MPSIYGYLFSKVGSYLPLAGKREKHAGRVRKPYTMKIYEVGGAIRDELMGLKSKDVDFSVEANSYEEMRDWMTNEGFVIFKENPEYLTIRAKPPRGSALEKRTNGADFVLCRKDSPGSDGRRPDYVEPGTIYDDLARRDFTINAIARDTETDEIIDPYNGTEDCETKCLVFVGDAETRIKEDGLRVMRGFRFQVTRGMCPVPTTSRALKSDTAIEALEIVSNERIVVELDKMFKHDTIHSLDMIAVLPFRLQKVIFKDNIRLAATLKS